MPGEVHLGTRTRTNALTRLRYEVYLLIRKQDRERTGLDLRPVQYGTKSSARIVLSLLPGECMRKCPTLDRQTSS
jgi:hypothetical protein